MIGLSFRFLTGRYHATPWGAHVNEGLVEWPPSPWRVLRALIATGYNRLGWAEVSPVAVSLLEKLASHAPRVYLPPARAAHSRHYMPLYKEKTTKVLDAFAHVGDGTVSFLWEATLTEDERAMLANLAAALPYLGRAESWAACSLVHEPPRRGATAECIASDAPPGPGLERVALLAPEPPQVFAAWREEAMVRERAAAMERAAAKAAQAGKAAPKKLSAAEARKIEEIYPLDIVSALSADTNSLRAHGWSQPPGSRWLSYWRPLDALRSTVPSLSPRRVGSLPTSALLALASDTRNHEALPALRDAILRMEVLHDALVRASDSDGVGAPAPVFTGRENGELLRGHRHASLVPLTLDGRADRIDHVLVHAPMGFDDASRLALSRVSRTWARDLPTIYVTVVGLGREEDLAPTVPQLRVGTTWVSRTPFVPPRHAKRTGKNAIEGQVRAELAARGLPEPRSVEVLDDGRRFRWFRRARRAPDRAPPSSMGLAIRIVFAEPVRGPISLGYASHFGLGSFVPWSESSTAEVR